ncbi:hypothetical protein AAII07_16000 [Microvirga sp. 0TCS3.31]
MRRIGPAYAPVAGPPSGRGVVPRGAAPSGRCRDTALRPGTGPRGLPSRTTTTATNLTTMTSTTQHQSAPPAPAERTTTP